MDFIEFIRLFAENSILIPLEKVIAKTGEKKLAPWIVQDLIECHTLITLRAKQQAV